MKSIFHSVDPGRSRLLKQGKMGEGPVLYWMSRDQRARDNWALLYAQDRALALERPLIVVFSIDLEYPSGNLRSFGFLLRGLQEMQTILDKHHIPFYLLQGDPKRNLISFMEKKDPALVVTDFDPLRIKQQWKNTLLHQSRWPVWEVDAHNIVPCWLASEKREYAAYTIRKKIQRQLSRFLTPFPKLLTHPIYPSEKMPPQVDSDFLLALVKNRQVEEVQWLQPGEKEGMQTFRQFLNCRLLSYPKDRNNPCLNGQSNLSPYFHFGHIAPQRVAWEVEHSTLPREAKDAYLEELIIRRELSDNFCYYTPNYDKISCFPQWAAASLNAHRLDPRPYKANLHILENAASEDPLWNGCQRDLAARGKLHGYLRMYWAKKILEWSDSPEEALENTIILNDTYSLDGRDPNGYAGIAWSIGGVHDRAWAERPIFGKIRYMNAKGCKRKFNVGCYLEAVNQLKT